MGMETLETELFLNSYPISVEEFEPSSYVNGLLHEYGMSPILDVTLLFYMECVGRTKN